MSTFHYSNVAHASAAEALVAIIGFLNDSNPAAPGTGPAWQLVQVYDPSASTPYEVPVSGSVNDLAVDNCFNPAAAVPATAGSWAVLNSSDVSHPFQIGLQLTSSTNIRVVIGNDMNKAGAAGGFDTTVQNSDITNAASWRDGKDYFDFGVTATANACWSVVAQEAAMVMVFDDEQTGTMRICPLGKMTNTNTNDNYPVIWFIACDRLWATTSDGLQHGSDGNAWRRFSHIDETTVVGLQVRDVNRWSDDDTGQGVELKDQKSGEWYLGKLEFRCPTASHMGGFGTFPIMYLTSRNAIPGYGKANMDKAGVPLGYALFSNTYDGNHMVVALDWDSATDVTA